MKKRPAFSLFLAVFLTACSFGTSVPPNVAVSTPIMITAEVSTVIASGPGTSQPFPTPEPPTPIPALAGGLSLTELKYRVLDQFPDFFFCDPDYFPVARDDEMLMAQQNFPELQANREEFQVILSHLGLGGQTSFTDEQKLQIYRDHKRLNAIVFQVVNDRYQFQFLAGSEGQGGMAITGTIDASGAIDISKREPAALSCPICLAAGTLIDTPRGTVQVEEMRVGDPVWTMDKAGRRVPASIVRTGHVSVPASHRMVHVTLSDGRELWASLGHPTSDGRRLADLRVGDSLNGARIVQAGQVPYSGGFTYDILPSGSTGFYWADGILMGSTLSSH